MDIQRPSNARAKKIRRIIYAAVAFLLIGGVSFGLSRLRPAAPTVDRATIWTDDVKRGPMLREVRGLGTLVPEDIRWIPAQTNATVERIVLRPGAIVHPHSVILELSDPQLQRDLLDAEYQLKGAEADYANLKVQVNSQLMNQKSVEASVRSDYEQARLQHDVDIKLLKEGIQSSHIEDLSRVKEEQLKIRLQLEEERTRVATDSAAAQLAAQEAKVEQQRALYNLKKSQYDALHLRAGIEGVLQPCPRGGRTASNARNKPRARGRPEEAQGRNQDTRNASEGRDHRTKSDGGHTKWRRRGARFTNRSIRPEWDGDCGREDH